MSVLRTRGKHRTGVTAAAVTAATLIPFIAAFAAPPMAMAADPVVKTGDLVTATFGGLLDGGSGLDRIDPTTQVRSRVASFGVNKAIDNVTSMSNGDLIAASLDGEVWKVNRATGVQTKLQNAFTQGRAAFSDLAMDPADKVLAIMNEPSATRIVRMATTPGAALTTIAQGGFVDGFAAQLAVESDGKILLTDNRHLVRIDPTSGAQSLVHTFASESHGVVVAKDGTIYVRTGRNTTEVEHLQRVDPKTGAATVVSTGKALHFNSGLAIEANGSLVSSEGGQAGEMVRINPSTGALASLFTFGSAENFDIAVAGVSQIPPIPLPKAGNDSFTAESPAAELHVAAPGLLGNDSDPLGEKLEVEVVNQPAAGFVSRGAPGEFTWFPPTGFTGKTSFTYRLVAADGRVSAPATVNLELLPDQTPTARDDFFNVPGNRDLQIAKPGILANDTDPQGDLLAARVKDFVKHGIVSIDDDNTLRYQPAFGFVGEDSFTYTVTDGKHVSAPAKVTFTVKKPDNTVPSITLQPGGTANTAGTAATVKVEVADLETPAANLKMSVITSNASVVPATAVTFGGSGENRTATITPKAGIAGTATLTLVATDATGLGKGTKLTVKTGSPNVDIITGGADADLLFGLGGNDTLNGGGGNDILVGGNDNDKLSGGSGADAFIGGAGTNTATDFQVGEGDTKTQISPAAAVAGGGTFLANGRGGTINLDVLAGAKVTATSSNQKLLPNANLTIKGSGQHRTLTAMTTKGTSGTAVVTVSVADAGVSTQLNVTVKMGTARPEKLTGTSGADMLFGQAGHDKLNGEGGNDLLCGGPGRDGLLGGSGADVFYGGPGRDALRDYTPAQGDTKR